MINIFWSKVNLYMAIDVVSLTNDFLTEFLQLVRLCGFEFSNYAGSAKYYSIS